MDGQMSSVRAGRSNVNGGEAAGDSQTIGERGLVRCTGSDEIKESTRWGFEVGG